MSETLRSVLPSYMAYCPACRQSATHTGVTDEHGCERGSRCDRCQTVNHPIECAFAAQASSQKRKAS